MKEVRRVYRRKGLVDHQSLKGSAEWISWLETVSSVVRHRGPVEGDGAINIIYGRSIQEWHARRCRNTPLNSLLGVHIRVDDRDT